MSKPNSSAQTRPKASDFLSIDWSHVDLEQFRRGLLVELEHGTKDPETHVTNDDTVLTGKIALAHLKEFPDYYTRLATLEAEAEKHWAKKREQNNDGSPFYSGLTCPLKAFHQYRPISVRLK